MSKLGDDYNDIEDCSNSSPFFGSLLEEQRYKEIVLPKVFSILSKLYQDNSDESFKETNLKSIPWNRPPTKPEINPMTNFWKCRLVCKSWNSAIENLHDDGETGHFSMKMDFRNPENANLENWAIDRFGSDSGAEKFLAHFDPTHFNTLTNQPKKNPFLGRCVQLYYYQNDDANNLHQIFIEMLRKYGQEIWYFCIFYFHVPGNPDQDVNKMLELYRDIRQFIVHCPKLRVFRILYNRQPPENYDNEVPLDISPSLEPTALETVALTQEIIENPLPKFTNLEYLSTLNLPTPIFNQLLFQNCAGISQMEIFRKEFHQNYNIFGGGELPKLENLGCVFTSVADFEQFENYPFKLNLENGPRIFAMVPCF